MNKLYFKTIILFFILITGCNPSENNTTPTNTSADLSQSNLEQNNHSKLFLIDKGIDTTHTLDYYFTKNEQDTLLIDLVAYIYRKPSQATWSTKLNPEFRNYYIKNSDGFEILFFAKKEATLYYYLTRPARDEKGAQLRGVGGKFTYNKENVIEDFEEVFNTPIMSKDSLKNLGYNLFLHLLEKDNIIEFVDNRAVIEWPDGRLFYSKEKLEWRYVD